MQNELEWLAAASQRFGRDIDAIQGTGGNISVKLDDHRMAIKASGTRLSNVTEHSGYSIVDYSKIAPAFDDYDEEQTADIVKAAHLSGGRPSIETGFHSFLGKYVIHLHPLCINTILCTNEARSILDSIFVKYTFVPYTKVGHDLSARIRQLHKTGPIMLENHGLIVSSNDPDECIDFVEQCRNACIEYLANFGYSQFMYSPVLDGGFLTNNSQQALDYLSSGRSMFTFPDAAVFITNLGSSVVQPDDSITYMMDPDAALNIDEILMAQLHIISQARKIGTVKFLSETDIKELLGMESEKYRKGVLGI